MTHISESQLNDYVDNDVDMTVRRALTAHLQACGECDARLRALRDLRDLVHALPRSIEPESNLLPGIRAQLHAPEHDTNPMLTLHAVSRVGAIPGIAPLRRRSVRWPALVAAGVALCLLSSAVTLLIVRRGETPAVVTAPPPFPSTTLVDLRGAELRYQSAIAELRAALLADRGALEPATVQVLEQSLAAIDRALADARTALATDPGNRELAELLHANYEKKLELLRRASAHARVRL